MNSVGLGIALGFLAGSVVAALLFAATVVPCRETRGIIHGRNLEWCESRGGQWRDAKCWRKVVEIKR